MKKHLFPYLKIAAFYGACGGFIAGHIDLVIRIINQFFEWFELYQAIALPVIFGSLLFLVIGFFRFTAGLILKRQYDVVREHRFYITTLTFLALFSLAQAVINFILFPDRSFWEMERLESSLLATFALLTVAVLVLKLRPTLLDRAHRSAVRFHIATAFKKYLSFAAVFSLACLAIDIFEVRNIPTLGPNPDREMAGPNVVVITLDTVRADYLTPYNSAEKTTPFLDQIGSESVIFENAFSTSSWTLPSHASIFTGKWVFNHGAYERYQLMDSTNKSLASILRYHGYRTAAFVGGPYCKAKHGFGAGFDTYKDRLDFFEYRHTSNRYSMQRLIEFFSPKLRWLIFGADGEKTAPEINKQVARWLDKNGSDPFFLFLNYFDAHEPYTSGKEYLHEFTSENRSYHEIDLLIKNFYYYADLRFKIEPVDPALTAYIAALYRSELRELDKHVKTFFNILEERGVLNNTIVIISSDHGEEFMEHDGFTHKQTLYRESIHVPLIIYYPNKFSPRRVKSAVSNMDIFATTLELAGIQDAQYFDSVSLVPLMTGQSDRLERDYVISELYSPVQFGDIRQYSQFDDNWHLIDVDPPQERMPDALFRTEDQLESNNLIEKEPEAWNRISSQLKSRRGSIREGK